MKDRRRMALGMAILVLSAALAFVLTASLRGRNDRQTIAFNPGDYSSAHDLIAFLDSNGPRLSKTDMDEAILKLLALQKSATKEHEKLLFSDEINPTINRYSLQDLARIDTIKEDAIRDLVSGIDSDELRISSSEGMFYLEIDYPGIRDRFGSQATDAMSGYLNIMARETEHHFAEDAALTVSPNELSDRLAAIESFLDRNTDFPLRDDVQRLQSYYLPALLLGLNNTPAFDYRTNRLKEPFLESYQSLIQKHAGTRLAGLVQGYLGVLEQNHFQKTRGVLDFTRDAAIRL